MTFAALCFITVYINWEDEGIYIDWNLIGSYVANPVHFKMLASSPDIDFLVMAWLTPVSQIAMNINILRFF